MCYNLSSWYLIVYVLSELLCYKAINLFLFVKTFSFQIVILIDVINKRILNHINKPNPKGNGAPSKTGISVPPPWFWSDSYWSRGFWSSSHTSQVCKYVGFYDSKTRVGGTEIPFIRNSREWFKKYIMGEKIY